MVMKIYSWAHRDCEHNDESISFELRHNKLRIHSDAIVNLPLKEVPVLLQALCKIPPVDELQGSTPLVCYFANETDRQEFIALMKVAKPSMRTVKV